MASAVLSEFSSTHDTVHAGGYRLTCDPPLLSGYAAPLNHLCVAASGNVVLTTSHTAVLAAEICLFPRKRSLQGPTETEEGGTSPADGGEGFGAALEAHLCVLHASDLQRDGGAGAVASAVKFLNSDQLRTGEKQQHNTANDGGVPLSTDIVLTAYNLVTGAVTTDFSSIAGTLAAAFPPSASPLSSALASVEEGATVRYTAVPAGPQNDILLVSGTVSHSVRKVKKGAGKENDRDKILATAFGPMQSAVSTAAVAGPISSSSNTCSSSRYSAVLPSHLFPRSLQQCRQQYPPIFAHSLTRSMATALHTSGVNPFEAMLNDAAAAMAAANPPSAAGEGEGAKAEGAEDTDDDCAPVLMRRGGDLGSSGSGFNVGAATEEAGKAPVLNEGPSFAFSGGFYPITNLQWMPDPLTFRPVYGLPPAGAPSDAAFAAASNGALPSLYEGTRIVCQQTLWTGERIVFGIAADPNASSSPSHSSLSPLWRILRVGILRTIVDPTALAAGDGDALALEWLTDAAPPVVLPDSFFTRSACDEVAAASANGTSGMPSSKPSLSPLISISLVSHASLGQRSAVFVHSSSSQQCLCLKMRIGSLPHMSASLEVAATIPSVAGLPATLSGLFPAVSLAPLSLPPVAFITADATCKVFSVATLLNNSAVNTRQGVHPAPMAEWSMAPQLITLAQRRLGHRTNDNSRTTSEAPLRIVIRSVLYQQSMAVGVAFAALAPTDAATNTTKDASVSAASLLEASATLTFAPIIDGSCRLSALVLSAVSRVAGASNIADALIAAWGASLEGDKGQQRWGGANGGGSFSFAELADVLLVWGGLPAAEVLRRRGIQLAIAKDGQTEQQPPSEGKRAAAPAPTAASSLVPLSDDAVDLLDNFFSAAAADGTVADIGALTAVLEAASRASANAGGVAGGVGSEPATGTAGKKDGRASHAHPLFAVRPARSRSAVAIVALALHMLFDGLTLHEASWDVAKVLAEGLLAPLVSGVPNAASTDEGGKVGKGSNNNNNKPTSLNVRLSWPKYAYHYKSLFLDTSATIAAPSSSLRDTNAANGTEDEGDGDGDGDAVRSPFSLAKDVSPEAAAAEFGVGIVGFIESGVPPSSLERIKFAARRIGNSELSGKGGIAESVSSLPSVAKGGALTWPLVGTSAGTVLSPSASASADALRFLSSSASPSGDDPAATAVAFHYLYDSLTDDNNADARKVSSASNASTAQRKPWWYAVTLRYAQLLRHTSGGGAPLSPPSSSSSSAAACVADRCRSACLGASLVLLEALAAARAFAADYFANNAFVLAAIGRTDVRPIQTSSAAGGLGGIVVCPPSTHLRAILSTSNNLGGDDFASDASATTGGGALVASSEHAVYRAQQALLQRQSALQRLEGSSSVWWGTSGDDDSVTVRTAVAETWRDGRLPIAQSILNTAVPISLSGAKGESSEEYRTELAGLVGRALALPVGRGMLTLGTEDFRLRDAIPVPPLVLDGVTADGLQIRLDALPDVSWARFHNGCAAGLRYLGLGNGGASSSSSSSSWGAVTRGWINYQTREDDSCATAGLILALGLLGHLRKLEVTDVHAILYRRRDHSAAALLLGLGVAYRASGNESIVPCLAMHVESLSRAAEDLEVPLHVQTTALVAIGLVRQGSCDPFMTGMLLGEISRPPTDQHAAQRGAYALGAGIALGLVGLGKGATAHNGAATADRLLLFLEGGRREAGARLGGAAGDAARDLRDRRGAETADHRYRFAALMHSLGEGGGGGAQLDGFGLGIGGLGVGGGGNVAACQTVLEGLHYDKAVTGPASAMALGLIFLRTNDGRVGRKVLLPPTVGEIAGVTPEMAVLRSLVGNLICWDSIGTTREWLYSVDSCCDSSTRGGFYGNNSVHSAALALCGGLPPALAELFGLPSIVSSPTSEAALSSGKTQNVKPIAPPKRMDHLPPDQQYLMLVAAHAIAGACLAMGLRRAGAIDYAVRDVLIAELHGFAEGKLGSTGIPLSPLQTAAGAFEACVSSCAIAVGLCMAGTGDAASLDVLRSLHQRCPPSAAPAANSAAGGAAAAASASAAAFAGTHLPVAMAIGLLFLGGGTCTVSTSTESLASLLIAFYPVWASAPAPSTATSTANNTESPTASSTDINAHFMQPLRHLYVAAAVPSVLSARDGESGEAVRAVATIHFKKRALPQQQLIALLNDSEWGGHNYADPMSSFFMSGGDSSQHLGQHRPSPFEQYNRRTFGFANAVEANNANGGASPTNSKTKALVKAPPPLVVTTPCLIPTAGEWIHRIEVRAAGYYPLTLGAAAAPPNAADGEGEVVSGDAEEEWFGDSAALAGASSIALSLAAKKGGTGDDGWAAADAVSSAVSAAIATAGGAEGDGCSLLLLLPIVSAASENVLLSHLRLATAEASVARGAAAHRTSHGGGGLLKTINVANVIAIHDAIDFSAGMMISSEEVKSAQTTSSSVAAKEERGPFIIPSDFVASLAAHMRATLVTPLLHKKVGHGSLSPLQCHITGLIHDDESTNNALLHGLAAMGISDPYDVRVLLSGYETEAATAAGAEVGGLARRTRTALRLATSTGLPITVAMALVP